MRLVARALRNVALIASPEAFMITETELFYLVVAIILTLLIQLILSNTGSGRGRGPHR
jgi:hypothetical protein